MNVHSSSTLSRSSEFTRICHNMNIVVQTTGGDTSSLKIKSEIPNNTLANIPWDIMLKPSHKEELWCFSYQYSIWISLLNKNRLLGDVPYFLWRGSRPSQKQVKIWGGKVYIINRNVTRKKLENRPYHGYFMGYAATTGVTLS